jgi:hypothetical protein
VPEELGKAVEQQLAAVQGVFAGLGKLFGMGGGKKG